MRTNSARTKVTFCVFLKHSVVLAECYRFFRFWPHVLYGPHKIGYGYVTIAYGFCSRSNHNFVLRNVTEPKMTTATRRNIYRESSNYSFCRGPALNELRTQHTHERCVAGRWVAGFGSMAGWRCREIMGRGQILRNSGVCLQLKRNWDKILCGYCFQWKGFQILLTFTFLPLNYSRPMFISMQRKCGFSRP